MNGKLLMKKGIRQPKDKKGAKGNLVFHFIFRNAIRIRAKRTPVKEAMKIAIIQSFTPNANDISAESFASPNPIFPFEKTKSKKIKANPTTPFIKTM